MRLLRLLLLLLLVLLLLPLLLLVLLFLLLLTAAAAFAVVVATGRKAIPNELLLQGSSFNCAAGQLSYKKKTFTGRVQYQTKPGCTAALLTLLQGSFCTRTKHRHTNILCRAGVQSQCGLWNRLTISKHVYWYVTQASLKPRHDTTKCSSASCGSVSHARGSRCPAPGAIRSEGATMPHTPDLGKTLRYYFSYAMYCYGKATINGAKKVHERPSTNGNPWDRRRG